MSYLIGMDNLSMEERAIREKLEVKRQEAIAKLGTKWVLHPNHSPKNSRTPVSVLEGISRAR